MQSSIGKYSITRHEECNAYTDSLGTFLLGERVLGFSSSFFPRFCGSGNEKYQSLSNYVSV